MPIWRAGEARRLIFIDSSEAKPRALEHRASPLPTVLLSPPFREGVDLPDDLLRFQIVTKTPYGDLGDPWTAACCDREPRRYAPETAKALVQTYGRGCRHPEDYGVTYVLDGQFVRFLQHYRPLLPGWFLERRMRRCACRSSSEVVWCRVRAQTGRKSEITGCRIRTRA